MDVLLVILIIFLGTMIFCSCMRSQVEQTTKERREKYAHSLGPSVRILVNDGVHFFFKDDEHEFFGLDESGKTYSFSGLESISKRQDSISLHHATAFALLIGKDIGHPDTTTALDSSPIDLIYSEMMPILRKNVQRELNRYGIVPTHEYERDGYIFGCDLHSKQFYCVYACISVHDFSELKRVTVTDVSKNRLCSANYIISVYIKDPVKVFEESPSYTLYFDEKDAFFYNLLAMFKGIRNRQK